MTVHQFFCILHCRYIDDVLSIIVIQNLRIIWVRSILLSFRSKTRRRATPMLPPWIYSCPWGETISCAFPFTTNVTISTSMSQNFRSWGAIFHFRQPMAFSSRSSSGMPGLATLMNILFWGSRGFHISFLGRYMSGSVLNRLLGSSMVDIGISSNKLWSFPPSNVTWRFGAWP